MAYTINFTDLVNKGSLTVEDNDINTQTSLNLVGRNTTSYGVEFNQNFLKLLENFANATPPANPVEGQLWWDSSSGEEGLKVYDGTQWIAAGGLKKATNAPQASASVTGDLWVDTDNQQLYLYTGSGWTLVGPEFSGGLNTGVNVKTIRGQDNIDYNVLQIEVEAKPIAIISTKTFSPRAVINGFSEIKPGVNLSTANITGDGAGKYYGVAEKAESLIVAGEDTPVLASDFLRGDKVSTTTHQLKVNSDEGIIVGSGNQMRLTVEGQTGVITHSATGSSLDVRVNDQGTTKTVMRIDSTTNIGINNTAPSEALDVTGKIKVSDSITIDGTTASTNFGTGSLIVKGGVGIAGDLNVGGNVDIIGNIETRNVLPDATNVRTIGSDANKYANIYATQFTGQFVGNLTGNISGTSQTADKLSSSTSFQMIGEVSAPTITFDGQQGGNTKTFNTVVSNSFISNKTSTSSAQDSDEFLVNRVQGATGLYRLRVENLLDKVPTNPPGIIMPYAGLQAPTHWLLCDGSEVLQADYQKLFLAIGFNFKPSNEVSDNGGQLFCLPDLRGRTIMGLDDMGGTAANRVTGVRGNELGNGGGVEQVTIAGNQIPDHEHDLQVGDPGAKQQFYTILDAVKGSGSVAGAQVYDAPTGNNQGQAATTSGSVAGTTGQPLDIMNPFMSLNWIIYTGNV